jgi:hypothetical protein
MLQGYDRHFVGRFKVWLGNVDFGDGMSDAAVLTPFAHLLNVF